MGSRLGNLTTIIHNLAQLYFYCVYTYIHVLYVRCDWSNAKMHCNNFLCMSFTWVHLGTPRPTRYTWAHLGIPGYTREHLDLPGPPDVQTDGHQKTACQRSISIYPQCGISTSLTHCSVPSKSE